MFDWSILDSWQLNVVSRYFLLKWRSKKEVFDSVILFLLNFR